MPDKDSGFSSISTSLPVESKKEFEDLCRKLRTRPGTMLRTFIDETIAKAKANPQAIDNLSPRDPVIIKIESFTPGSTIGQGGHSPVNAIIAEEEKRQAEAEIHKTEEFLQKQGWVPITMRKSVVKACRHLDPDKGLEERLRPILAAPNEKPSVLPRNTNIVSQGRVSATQAP